MTAEIELPFPGNRALAGWWKQFSPARPAAIWIGHLPLQTLELPAQTARPEPLDGQTRMLLEAIRTLEGSSRPLHDRLGLPVTFLQELLEPLLTSKLAEIPTPGEIRLTPAGVTALAESRYTVIESRRRGFSFLDLESNGQPVYVPFTAHLRLPRWDGAAESPLGLSGVEPFLQLDLARKEELGFPVDVLGFSQVATDPRFIPLHRTERLTVVAIAGSSSSAEPRVHLYPVRPETWSTSSHEPLLTLDARLFPIANEETWRTAWKEWCRSRNVLTPETEGATLSLHPGELHVTLGSLPVPLTRQFGEWIKSELWLLAGEGRIRQAAALRIDLA